MAEAEASKTRTLRQDGCKHLSASWIENVRSDGNCSGSDMGKANSTCFGCGDTGHFESECPNKGIDATGKPSWCGFCDERTRLIDHGESMSRCQECHPLRRQSLKQHRKCPSCHVTVYNWDAAPCGQHTGPQTPDRRPEREHIDTVVAKEMEPA